MKLVLDRTEGDIAVFETEDERTVNIPAKLLEPDHSDGDIYEFVFLKKETAKRRKAAEAKLAKLLKNQ